MIFHIVDPWLCIKSGVASGVVAVCHSYSTKHIAVHLRQCDELVILEDFFAAR